MPTLHPTQAHTALVMCAETAAGVFREAEAIVSKGEKVGTRHSS